MHLSKQYIKTEESQMVADVECIIASQHTGHRFERIRVLTAFAQRYDTVLNVGSGGYLPLLVKTTHAIDVSTLAEQLLRKYNWKGPFTVASCTELPFECNSFNCGICSEVIEHLPSISDVEDTLNELDRVCKEWIISTPCIEDPNPDHKRLFTEEQISEYAARYDAKFMRYSLWWFIWKSRNDPHFPSDVPDYCPTCLSFPGVPRGMSHG